MTDLTAPILATTPVVTVGGKLGLMPDAAGNDALGLVTDAPAPLSMLGRLKTIGDALVTLATALLVKPGLGDMTAVPAGSVNGTLLGVKPAAAREVRLYLPVGASVTFAIASAAPVAVPRTFTASATDTGPNWDESLADASNVYVTAIVGSPSYRWL